MALTEDFFGFPRPIDIPAVSHSSRCTKMRLVPAACKDRAEAVFFLTKRDRARPYPSQTDSSAAYFAPNSARLCITKGIFAEKRRASAKTIVSAENMRKIAADEAREGCGGGMTVNSIRQMLKTMFTIRLYPFC